jgi:hypothetical protein
VLFFLQKMENFVSTLKVGEAHPDIAPKIYRVTYLLDHALAHLGRRERSDIFQKLKGKLEELRKNGFAQKFSQGYRVTPEVFVEKILRPLKCCPPELKVAAIPLPVAVQQPVLLPLDKTRVSDANYRYEWMKPRISLVLSRFEGADEEHDFVKVGAAATGKTERAIAQYFNDEQARASMIFFYHSGCGRSPTHSPSKIDSITATSTPILQKWAEVIKADQSGKSKFSSLFWDGIPDYY